MNAIAIRFIRIAFPAATFGFLAWYSHSHPEVIYAIRNASALAVLCVVLLYVASIFCLTFVLQSMLHLFGLRLDQTESLLLTAYSSLVNFFGPGQSGPGLRALYLHLRLGLKIQHFALGTFIYFGWLITLSFGMLWSANLMWWQILAIQLFFSILYFLTATLFLGAQSTSFLSTQFKPRLKRMVFLTGVGTCMQISLICGAYFIELRSANPSVTLAQCLAYTGAANFSLFVSITPGAIGIREALLLFTENIHTVDRATVVAASVLDRGIYFLVLALLGLFATLTHASRKFRQLN